MYHPLLSSRLCLSTRISIYHCAPCLTRASAEKSLALVSITAHARRSTLLANHRASFDAISKRPPGFTSPQSRIRMLFLGHTRRSEHSALRPCRWRRVIFSTWYGEAALDPSAASTSREEKAVDSLPTATRGCYIASENTQRSPKF